MKNVQIATPVSHLFFDPKVGRRIMAKSDCLEARERTIHLDLPKRKLFHVDIDITHPWSSDRHQYLRESFSLLPDLKLVTFQASVNCDQPELREGMYLPGGRTFARTEMMRFARENVAWLRKNLPQHVEIGVENNNYYPTPAYDIVADSDFIKEVVEDNHIVFLLDIAHAFVTAHNKAVGFDEYLSGLPMQRCLQLHLCQPEVFDNNLAIDAHELPSGDLLAKARTLISSYRIQYLTIEYYKDPERLIEALNSERKYFELQ